ncbi:hypothetical protein B9Z55_008022 [Caenorhabditis nigoni]|nr:hypothetical protein B9Z55_008022 [Caenorhabditis nigoni]
MKIHHKERRAFLEAWRKHKEYIQAQPGNVLPFPVNTPDAEAEGPEAVEAPEAQEPEAANLEVPEALEPQDPEEQVLEDPEAPEADRMEEDEQDPEDLQAAGPEEEEAAEAPGPVRQPIPPPRELANYELLKVIGSGSFGKVFHARHRRGGQICAIKVVKKPRRPLEEDEDPESDDLKREIMFLLERYNSPFLLRMKDVFESPVKVYFVLKFMAGGDLRRWTGSRWTGTRPQRLNEDAVRFYMSELVLAVEFLHKRNYIHRDIKRENIFVHRSGHIKLADFGFVRRLQRGETLDDACGTHFSPEMKQEPASYGLPADIWAVGIVMYELATREVVHEDSQLRDPRTKKLRMLGRLRQPCKDLLEALLAEDPEERPKIREVKKMEFFEGLNWRTVAGQVPPRIPTLDGDEDLRYFPQSQKAKDPIDDPTDYIRVSEDLFIP